jgi:protein tyrosine/serine phosphatase
VLASALTTAAIFVSAPTEPYHFLVVTPGVLYRSGTLDPDHLARVLNRYEIRTVVNLRTPREQSDGEWRAQEVTTCRQSEVELIDLPMRTNVPDIQQIDEWLRILADPARLPVLVHCAHGVQRTGVMVAIYEMERLGKTKEEVLSGMPFGHRLHGDAHRFILNYVPRREYNTPQLAAP